MSVRYVQRELPDANAQDGKISDWYCLLEGWKKPDFAYEIRTYGERCGVVVKALCYKPEGRGFDTRWGDFLNLPNPSGPGVYSTSNRNEYQKLKNNNVSGEQSAAHA
jgi:hypothetical protein